MRIKTQLGRFIVKTSSFKLQDYEMFETMSYTISNPEEVKNGQEPKIVPGTMKTKSHPLGTKAGDATYFHLETALEFKNL